MERRALAQSSSRDQCIRGPSSGTTRTPLLFKFYLCIYFILYIHGTQVSHITGHSRPPGEVGLSPRQYTEWNVVGARSFYWRFLSVGAAA